MKYRIYMKVKKLLLFVLLAPMAAAGGLPAAEDAGFVPFERSLKGLEELFFVKDAIINQNHKPGAARLTSSQAVKAVKLGNPVLGFEYTERVQSFLDFYTSQEVRTGVEVMLGVLPEYMLTFETFLSKENLPLDLMYLPMALSSLNTKTVSSWGAAGIWQIMFTNGKLYNLQIDSYVDERKDPEKSTQAAVLYLKDLYNIYLDWQLAIAAYSSGPASINKAIRKAGGSKKYEDLYPFLPVETRDYLPAFTACFILATHHEQSGLKAYEIDLPNYTQKEPVTARLHLGQVAEVLHVQLPLLQDMNPEYKSSIIPAGARQMWIKLPREKIEEFRLLADSIYGYNDSIYFPSRKTYIVAEAPPVTAENGNGNKNGTESTQTPASQPNNKTKLSYTVKEGDNLGHISDWYDVSVSEIRQWNSLRGDVIKVGQKLDIYVADSKVSKYKGIDDMSFAEKQKGTTAAKATPQKTTGNQTTTGAKAATSGYTWYTVKKGDTVSAIAAKYAGVSADEILKINNIKDPRSLQVGQKIKIPKK